MLFGKRITLPILALPLLFSSAAGHATGQTPAIVHVDMMDPSTNPSITSMMLKTDAKNVKAGPVEFEVSNDSKDLVHEMIVVSVANPGARLPYDRKDSRVIESKIEDLGEASDLNPGEKKILKLTLKPGSYLLICNQPNHYKAGMRTNLLVTP